MDIRSKVVLAAWLVGGCGGDDADPTTDAGDTGSTTATTTASATEASSDGASDPGSTSQHDTGSTGEPGDTSTTGPALEPGDPLGEFQLTYYWVASEDDYGGEKTAVLYDPDCGEIATVDPEFADALALEGTGRLSDGRLLNYDGACDCPSSPCFFEVDARHPWGYGAEGRALVPFRSVAVDTAVVEIGRTLYLEELDGVSMPGDPSYGAFVHDGCVVADDVGGGIDGQHVDFFAALRPHYLELDGALGLSSVHVRDGGERCAAYGG